MFKVEKPVPGEPDTAFMKILYPSSNTRPLPVVIFFSGADIESNRYQWLSEHLVENCDVIVVTYDMFISTMGQTVLLFTNSMKYSPKYLNTAVETSIEKLYEINDEGPLQGALDLTRIVLGGHSAGGGGALADVSQDFVSRIKGRFTYGSHMAISVSEGTVPGSVHRLSSTTPTLLMAGTRDGLIAQSGKHYYGLEWKSSVDPIERTFARSFPEGTPVCLFEFEGFNHFAITYPDDCTHMTIEKDFEATVPKEEMKKKLAEIITLFVKETAWGDREAGSELRGYAQRKDPYIHKVLCKGAAQ